MKKLLLLFTMAVVIAGCTSTSAETRMIGDFKNIEIDSCEYLKAVSVGGISYFSHKGNCRFCKERRQKELEELVIKLKEK